MSAANNETKTAGIKKSEWHLMPTSVRRDAFGAINIQAESQGYCVITATKTVGCRSSNSLSVRTLLSS